MALTKRNMANVLELLTTIKDTDLRMRYTIYGYLEACLQSFDIISPSLDDDNFMENLYQDITIKHLLWKDDIRKETKQECIIRLANELIDE